MWEERAKKENRAAPQTRIPLPALDDIAQVMALVASRTSRVREPEMLNIGPNCLLDKQDAAPPKPLLVPRWPPVASPPERQRCEAGTPCPRDFARRREQHRLALIASPSLLLRLWRVGSSLTPSVQCPPASWPPCCPLPYLLRLPCSVGSYE